MLRTPVILALVAAPLLSQAPPASAGHNLVYAHDLGVVLLVNAGLGGMRNVPPATARTRIWSWNGSAWRVIDSAGPPVRNLAGVAYDSRRHVLVMHGGTYDLGHSYAETWEWSARSGGTWRHVTGSGPGFRDHTQMAYDSARGRMVLFGGSGTDPNVGFRDTWEFDGTRWELMATTGPPARVHHAMAYDPAQKRIVLFGGFTPGQSDLGDTWTWDGTHWTQLPGRVAPRTHARMAYDGSLNAIVLAGEVRATSGAPFMVLRNNVWLPLNAMPQPDARYLTDIAYDAKRKRLVLFGGGDPGGMALFDDTWEFDGEHWLKLQLKRQ